MDLLKASWKTTLGGILGFLSIVLGQVQYLLDDDPETTMNVSIIASAFAVLWMGLVSRDNNVTSRQAGAE